MTLPPPLTPLPPPRPSRMRALTLFPTIAYIIIILYHERRPPPSPTDPVVGPHCRPRNGKTSLSHYFPAATTTIRLNYLRVLYTIHIIYGDQPSGGAGRGVGSCYRLPLDLARRRDINVIIHNIIHRERART